MKAVSIWLQRCHPLHFEVAIYCWEHSLRSSPGSQKSLETLGYNLWFPQHSTDVSSRQLLVPCRPCLPSSGPLCFNSSAVSYPGNKGLRRGAPSPFRFAVLPCFFHIYIYIFPPQALGVAEQDYKPGSSANNRSTGGNVYYSSSHRVYQWQPCNFQRMNKLKSTPHFLPKIGLLLLTPCIISYCCCNK